MTTPQEIKPGAQGPSTPNSTQSMPISTSPSTPAKASSKAKSQAPQSAQSAQPAQSSLEPARAPKTPAKRHVKAPAHVAELPDSLASLRDLIAKPNDASSEPSLPEVDLGPRHSGLIAIVGRPNVGKSTLMNALVGQKISITSKKAQTTRHRITGIRNEGQSQLIFVDTPGFQTLHNNALNRSLNKTVLGAVGDVDLVIFVVEAGHFSLGDAKVLDLLKPGTKVVLLANKVDQVHNKEELMPWLKDMQARFDFYAIFPMSAKSPKDIERLVQLCVKDLPEQEWWYLNDELTDRSEKFLASEIIREKLFRLTGDELPYTSTVIIDKFTEEPGRTAARMVKIAATIVVEREGHKAMVIGEKGEKLKRMGTDARQELERLMDAKVFLEIWVKVRSGWADDEARVRSFGYE